MDRITLSINGTQVAADPDATVLEAALEAGVYIPNLCHHRDLDPVGVCRLCLVEIEGRGTTISCKTPVAEGMVVQTETPGVDAVRRVAVELLIASHPEDCLSCAKNDQCELQRVAAYVGVDRDRLARLRRPTETTPVDTSNPFFNFDRDRCILCGICVRTCEELQGVSAIDFVDRGYRTTIGTFGGRPFAESRCESCGECVVRCPVGALSPKNVRKPACEVKTTCPYCGVGCGLYLGVRGQEIVSVRGNPDAPANRGSLCVKGRFGHRFVNHPDRLTSPLIKRDGKFTEATWDEALDLVAAKLSQHKGHASALFASAKCTNEENYLAQKFARVVMGTQSIDHCARL